MEVYKKEPFRKTCLHVWNMREAVEAWLKYGKADWKPTTYRTYRQIAEKYIVPFLGNMKIDRITAHTLDHFRRQINSGNGRYLSNNYQFYICSLVRRILMYTIHADMFFGKALFCIPPFFLLLPYKFFHIYIYTFPRFRKAPVSSPVPPIFHLSFYKYFLLSLAYALLSFGR